KFVPTATTDTVSFLVPVVNTGEVASNPTTVVVQPVRGGGWGSQEVALDAIPARGSQTVTLALQVPDGVAPGTVQKFDVVADPKGISGDPSSANNSLEVSVSMPVAAATETPTESPTPSSISPPPETEPPPSTGSTGSTGGGSGGGEPGIPLVGGLL